MNSFKKLPVSNFTFAILLDKIFSNRIVIVQFKVGNWDFHRENRHINQRQEEGRAVKTSNGWCNRITVVVFFIKPEYKAVEYGARLIIQSYFDEEQITVNDLHLEYYPRCAFTVIETIKNCCLELSRALLYLLSLMGLVPGTRYFRGGSSLITCSALV